MATKSSELTRWSSKLARWLDAPRQLLIDGSWRDSVGGGFIDVIDPATAIVMGRVAEGREPDIDAAVQAARRSFESGIWRNLGGEARSRVLWRVADLLEQNTDMIAELTTRENGQTLDFARKTVSFCAEGWRYYAGFCAHINGHAANLVRPGTNGLAYSVREPVGVVGGIGTWNGPLMGPTWKIAPALAAGCSSVFKSAEEAPLTSVLLGELLVEAGVPAGVVNIVPGFGAVAGDALARHPEVNKITFTGSTVTGKKILAASVSSLKRVSLELGGKSPFIVFNDADIDRAIFSSTMSFCANAGQICVAGSRLLVQRASYERVVEGVARCASQLRIGNGLDAETQMGPLISGRQLDRVASYIDAGKLEGATIVVGGRRVGNIGYFIEPTVFANVRREMKIVQEEIFGPVLTVMPFDDEDEAIAIANDTLYGLASYVWTSDHSRSIRVSAAIRSGMVLVNSISFRGYEFAVGGYKQSGIGRENGPTGIDEFLETKWVITQTDR